MKYYFQSILLAGVITCLFSCHKDNYDPPSSSFTGRITYQGQPIGVKNSTGGTSNVFFELWQPGFGKSGAITVPIAQDGSFSSLLFDGDYKLVIPKAQGPFMSLTNKDTNSDTIPLTIRGNQTMDIEVLPYYTISNANFSLAADSTVSGSCALQKVITDADAKNIESVTLYVNRTSFVDEDNQIATSTMNAADITDMNNIRLTTKIPSKISNYGTANQNYFYARIGVKIADREDKLFSQVVKINF